MREWPGVHGLDPGVLEVQKKVDKEGDSSKVGCTDHIPSRLKSQCVSASCDCWPSRVTCVTCCPLRVSLLLLSTSAKVVLTNLPILCVCVWRPKGHWGPPQSLSTLTLHIQGLSLNPKHTDWSVSARALPVWPPLPPLQPPKCRTLTWVLGATPSPYLHGLLGVNSGHTYATGTWLS